MTSGQFGNDRVQSSVDLWSRTFGSSAPRPRIYDRRPVKEAAVVLKFQPIRLRGRFSSDKGVLTLPRVAMLPPSHISRHPAASSSSLQSKALHPALTSIS